MGNGRGSGVEKNESNKCWGSLSRWFSATAACSQQGDPGHLAQGGAKIGTIVPKAPCSKSMNLKLWFQIPSPSSGSPSVGQGSTAQLDLFLAF